MSVYNFPQFEDQYDVYKMRAMVDEIIRQFQGLQQESPAAGGGGGGTTVHNDLTGRSDPDCHPIAAITGLQAALDLKANQSDLLALAVVVQADINDLAAHEADLSIHFTEASIDHLNIMNIGVNSHAAIDTHIADATIHFTEASIDHTAIMNIGVNSHAAIDAHIADATIHFTEASIDHGSISGLADDDHLQYLLLAGRAGGQQAFGGTAISEELALRGTTNANLGLIRAQAPIQFDDVTAANALQPYSVQDASTQTITTAFVGGTYNASPVIGFSAATFIWEALRGAPVITSGVSPAFAAFTLFQALPTLNAGAGATHNPLQPFALNAGLTAQNTFAGTRTVPNLRTISSVMQLRTTVNLAVMNSTVTTGYHFSPVFSTVAGSSVDFGTVRGLHCVNIAPGFLAPSGGTETMVAYIGLDMNAIPFGGNVTKRALRSALTIATNSLMFENTGGAWSDHGAGFIQWDDNAGVIFGTGTDVFIRWNSVQSAIEFNTFFGIGNSPVFWRPDGNNSWIWESVNELGLQYEVENVSYGQASAAPGVSNWFVNYQPLDLRVPEAGAGDYSDVLFETGGGSLDVDGLAMVNVQVIRVEQPVVTLSGGTVADFSNLFLDSMPDADATLVQALRTLGRARVDGAMNNGSFAPAQITADQNNYQLGQHNNGRTVNLLDGDDDYNITGIDSSFGFAQDGDRIFIYNDGSFDLSLTHQDASSLAANRFITPESVPYVIHPSRGVWIWYDDTGVDRWRVLATMGHLERALHLSGDQFRKGSTAPTDVTIGSTPTIPALLFDSTNELASLYHSLPADLDRSQDVILRLQCSLSSVETNLDTCDFTCDYTAPTLVTAEGIAKTSTQVTGQFTAVTGRLAVGDIYEMDITFPFGDATNPLVDALGIAFEIHLTNTTGVGDIHVIDGDFIYQALRS